MTIFFRVPQQEAGLAPDHAVRAFYEVRDATLSEASALLGANGLHVFVVTGGEQLVVLASGEPGYSLSPLAGEGTGIEWRELLDGVFASVGVSCVADLMVRPIALPQASLAALRSEIERLSLLESAFTSERQTTGREAELARRGDPVAGQLQKDLETLLEAVLGGLVYECTIRVVSSAPAAGELLARVIGSSLSGGQRFDVLHLGPGDLGHDGALQLARSFAGYGEGQRPIAALAATTPDATTRLEAFRHSHRVRAERLEEIGRLNRVVGSEVATAMLRLPTSRGAAFRTMALDTTAEAAVEPEKAIEPALIIGRAVETGHLFSIGARELLRHVFTSGFTGSGKTTTIKVLLRQLWERHEIPFLVLEPAKAEYRALLRCGPTWARSLRIFTPGLERLSPLRFNPFAVAPDSTVEEHIATLNMCLAATMSLGGPLDAFLDAGIRRAYQDIGADEEDLGEECDRFPNVDSLLEGVRAVAREAGYQGEVAGNLDAAIRKRVEPLTWGSVGQIFRTEEDFPATADLLVWPTVIELQALTSGQQSFLTLLYLSLAAPPSADARAERDAAPGDRDRGGTRPDPGASRDCSKQGGGGSGRSCGALPGEAPCGGSRLRGRHRRGRPAPLRRCTGSCKEHKREDHARGARRRGAGHDGRGDAAGAGRCRFALASDARGAARLLQRRVPSRAPGGGWRSRCRRPSEQRGGPGDPEEAGVVPGGNSETPVGGTGGPARGSPRGVESGLGGRPDQSEAAGQDKITRAREADRRLDETAG